MPRTRKDRKLPVSSLARRIGALSNFLQVWWRSDWIWVAGLLLAAPVFVVAWVAWQLAQKPVVGTEGLILQEQMLIAVVQSLLAYAVAMSALSSVRLAQRANAEEKRRQRRALCSALVGSAIECLHHAGSVANLQGMNLRWPGKHLPDTKAQASFAVKGWQLMSVSAAAASKNVEQMRYEEPDLLLLALDLFDEIGLAVESATHGRTDEVLDIARKVRQKANRLHTAVQAPDESHR